MSDKKDKLNQEIDASTFVLNQNEEAIRSLMPDIPIKRLMQMLGSTYRFEELLGKGGFAQVFKVTNLSTNRTEALKVLLDIQHMQSDFAERFTHEAQVSASLDHPNIIPVYEFGRQEDLFWFSMEYIKGPSLEKELRLRGAMDEIEAVSLILPLLDALEYSHSRGVIHRDIKPGNIMLDMKGKPYLMDFGIAKSMGSLLKTQTGQYLGTPLYMAPEQLSGKPIDKRADIYAMGVTLYELLTGKFPFPADNPMQSLVSRLTRDPILLSSIRSDIDPKLQFITMRALERVPGNRFSKAQEMHSHLIRFLGPGHVSKPLEIKSRMAVVSQNSSTLSFREQVNEYSTVIQPPIKRNSKKKKPIRFIVGAITLVLALVVTGLFFMDKNPSSTQPAKVVQPLIKKNTPEPTIKKDKEKVPEKNKVTKVRSPLKKKKSAAILPKPVKKQPLPERVKPPVRAVVPPQLLKEAQPVFSTTQGKNCAGQLINLTLVIGKDGKVTKTRIISSGHPPECKEVLAAVQEAVMKYVFKPALDVDQNPTQSTIAIAVQL